MLKIFLNKPKNDEIALMQTVNTDSTKSPLVEEKLRALKESLIKMFPYEAHSNQELFMYDRKELQAYIKQRLANIIPVAMAVYSAEIEERLTTIGRIETEISKLKGEKLEVSGKLKEAGNNLKVIEKELKLIDETKQKIGQKLS